MPKKPPILHVVQRLNWRQTNSYLLRLPGTTRLCSFSDAGEAERERDDREARARALVNPFLCGGAALHYQTSFDEGRLCDWLLDADLEPPKPSNGAGRDWGEWWRAHHERMTEVQRLKVWQALDKVRFFEVVLRPARPVVYLVMRIGWRYNDEFYVATEEGGDVFTDSYHAYRNRSDAEYDCKENNSMARDSWEDALGRESDDLHSLDLATRLAIQSDPLQPGVEWKDRWKGLRTPEQVEFWEVVEVEVDE